MALSRIAQLASGLDDNDDEVRTTPLTAADHVLFYIQIALVLSNCPAVIYMIWNRKYPPIKAKQVWVTAALGCSIVPLSLSTAVVSGATTQTGVFKDCHSWASWGLMLFGFGPVFSLANYRLITFYRVFVANKVYSLRRKRSWKEFANCYWPLAALFLPALVSCVVTEILPEEKSAGFQMYNGIPTCFFRMNYAYWIASYCFAQVLVSWILYFLMRGIAKSFNEFKTVLPGLLILTCSLILYTVVLALGGVGYVWGRSLNAVVFSVGINSYFWLIVAKPIFGHIFQRDRCLKSFLEAMHEDGLTAARIDIPGVHKELYGMEGTAATPNHTTTLVTMASRLNRRPSFQDSIADESSASFAAARLSSDSVLSHSHSDVPIFMPAYSDIGAQQPTLYRHNLPDEHQQVKFEFSTHPHII
ncbi:hypothetical protein GQ54DRAFT_24911 [Martensiomyces pterosporus]|nr:hypothetical protein GQ54DRAFT_24911 [Martensiomyces pterosporus]